MTEDTKNFKKKKLDYELAENVDNTAPFKTIVASLELKRGKEKALSHFINSTIRKRVRPGPHFALTDFIFPSVPRNVFTNDWDGGLSSRFFQSTPYKSLMPWMMTPTTVIDKPDPLTHILHEKYEWIKKWSTIKSAYGNLKRHQHKWFGDEILYCPKYLVQMAEHIEENPDQFLSTVNNWYYAGRGNMQVTSVDGMDYIIHSSFNCLYITPFFKDNLSLDYSNTVTFKCPEESNILETIQSLYYVALRTKTKIFILKLINTDGLRLEKLKEIDSELPFTSISFDEFHKNILYVTTLDYNLKIVNLDRMTARSKKLRGKFTTLVDNWSAVISSQRGYYAHTSRKAITLYDKRTNEPFQRWKRFKSVSDIETCTKLTAAKYCHDKPLMYVAAQHHLFLMDMRCDKTKNGNIKPVQRWTHGMMSDPTYINISKCDLDNREMVSLSSQWLEDMCVVTNYSDTLTRQGEIPGLSVPYRPPSILLTLFEAHKKNVCYNLYNRIHERLCTSISGMALMQRGECQTVLLQNSIGDISCHNLYPESMHAFIEDDGVEKLDEWCKHYTFERKFDVSYVIDIQKLLQELSKVPDDYILGRNAVIKQRFKFNENEIYETYDKQQLDPEFLELWKEQEAEITLDDTAASQFFA